MILKFELLILILVRTFRESNVRLYTAVLTAITSWMFALDRTNYVRWLPVQTDIHTSTMISWVIENSQYRRRLTPFHAHKQNNELIKEEEWGYWNHWES